MTKNHGQPFFLTPEPFFLTPSPAFLTPQPIFLTPEPVFLTPEPRSSNPPYSQLFRPRMPGLRTNTRLHWETLEDNIAKHGHDSTGTVQLGFVFFAHLLSNAPSFRCHAACGTPTPSWEAAIPPVHSSRPCFESILQCETLVGNSAFLIKLGSTATERLARAPRLK